MRIAIKTVLFTLFLSQCLLSPAQLLAAPRPVYIGLDAEFGYTSSTSAEAIGEGIEIAMEEINRSGGVLGGRPLKLETRPNHSVPARSIWGRSSLKGAEQYSASHGLQIAGRRRSSPSC